MPVTPRLLRVPQDGPGARSPPTRPRHPMALGSQELPALPRPALRAPPGVASRHHSSGANVMFCVKWVQDGCGEAQSRKPHVARRPTQVKVGDASAVRLSPCPRYKCLISVPNVCLVFTDLFPDRCRCGCVGHISVSWGPWGRGPQQRRLASRDSIHGRDSARGDPRCRPQDAPHPEMASTQFDPKTAGRVPHPSHEERASLETECGWVTRPLGPPIQSLSRALKKPLPLAREADRPPVAFPGRSQDVRKSASRFLMSRRGRFLFLLHVCHVTQEEPGNSGLRPRGSPPPPPLRLGATLWKVRGLRALAGRGSCPGEVHGPHRLTARVLLARSLTGRCVLQC